jgi:rhamnosyltransferase
MVNAFPGYDIDVVLTQDVYLEDAEAIGRLIASFKDERLGAVCGRQLPHLNPAALVQHARLFNYPVEPRLKSPHDASVLGTKTSFMSKLILVLCTALEICWAQSKCWYCIR